MDWDGHRLQTLAGGYSGETFRVEGGIEDLVVRTYRRDPDRLAVDYALHRLVRGIVPVPEVVEVRMPEDGNPGVMVTRMLPGSPLDVVLDAATGDELDWESLGHNVGVILARLAGIPLLQPGLFDGPDLRADARSLPDDLGPWAARFRETGRLATWPNADWEGLRALVEHAEDVIDGVGPFPRTVLVHSDFNPKNLLVDPDTLEVTGVVDWEFAFGGAVYTDFGNFTRFERHPALLRAVADAFATYAPGPVEDAFERGRALDLWALIELAGRDRRNAVTDGAMTLLLAQARSGDLGAWPWDALRWAPIRP